MEQSITLIVTILLILFAARNGRRKRTERQEESTGTPFEPFGPQGPFGPFSPFDSPEQPAVERPRKAKAPSQKKIQHVMKHKAAKTPSTVPADTPTEETPASESENRLSAAEEFDLRRAIIYSEILKPKFAEEEQ